MLAERLRLARTMAGLSMRELAEKAGISYQAVGFYEKRQRTPSSAVLLKLAKALGVRLEFFMRPATVSLSGMKFRQKQRRQKRQSAKIKAQIQDRIERYLLAESFVAIDDRPKLPQYAVQDMEEVEEVAKKWRRDWKLGFDPIENLVEMAEARGVKVVLIDAPDCFSGCAVRADDSIPVLVVNKNLTECRFRLTFVHELAHLVVTGRPADWPEKKQEDLAYRLGEAFLVPDEAVYRELGPKRHRLDWAELRDLKFKYGLSMAAWIMRAAHLGIISENLKVSLFREMSQRKWRKNEPGDEETQERSNRFERLLLRAVAEDCISEARAAEVYGGPLDNVRRQLMECGQDADTSGG